MSIKSKISIREETKKIIKPALNLTLKQIESYYNTFLIGKPDEIRELALHERDELMNNIYWIEHFYIDTSSERILIRREDYDNTIEIIGNCLILYHAFLKVQLKEKISEPIYNKLLRDIMQLIDSDKFKFREYDLTKYLKYISSENIDVDKKTGSKKLLFMSYANEDRKDVGAVCDILVSKYGYAVFMAHETIRIGKEWMDEIFSNLDQCDGLIAWVTNNFRSKAWPHQECGYARAIKKPIFSVLLTKEIPGFLSFVQGFRPKDPQDYKQIAQRLHDDISKYLL